MADRKRIRERDRSPDMFLTEETDDETDDENVVTSSSRKLEDTKGDSGIDTSENLSIMEADALLKDFFETPTSDNIPAKKRQMLHCSFTQQEGNIQTLLGSRQSGINCTMNSLMSSASSTFNCGLNKKMNEALRSTTQTKRRLDYSTISSTPGQTPAVYTLNNPQPGTQMPVHSGAIYGLSDSTWKIIQDTKKIKELYKWQDECLNRAIQTEKNLIYSLPTSGGKTLVAELLMIRELLCKRKDCLYVLPYVSIVQEKIRTLSSQALALDFAVEEYAADRGVFPPRQRKSKHVIYIATLEKAHGIINCLMELGRLSEIGLVVVDEIHIIGEGKRGATLETLLCKLLLSPVSPRIVAMSATIGNIDELSSFLKADIYTEDFRPVTLREFVKIEDKLLLVHNGRIRCPENLLTPARCLPIPSAATQKCDSDGLGALVAEVAPEHSCLVFCATKMNCESVCQIIIRQLPPAVLQWKSAEKRALRKALEQQSERLCPILKSTLAYGVAYHHSGLTADERQLIEEAFMSGVLCCLCCTSTLAAGVNLPARRVILRSPYIGSQRLTRARYQQMIGRAGRAGFDTHGESILIVRPSEMPFVTQDILLAPIEHVRSQLAEDGLQGLQQLILSLISLDLCGKERLTLCKTLGRSTLLGLQNSHQTAEPLLELVDQSLGSLLTLSLITVDNGDVQVSKLGRAALKGNIELDRSTRLYDDLRFAQNGQILTTKLHLMYLITPYNLVGTIRPLPNPYLEAFYKLSTDDLNVAKSLGITETVMVKLASGFKPSNVEPFVLERFYLTLMLNDLYKGKSFWKVADFYGCARGDVQNLLTCAVSFVSCVHYFVLELGEFWGLSDLLHTFVRELSMTSASELIPLMELPSVPKGRARLLYDAGFRSLADVAKSSPEDLLGRVLHLSKQAAHHMVAAAQVLVYERIDALREEADSLLQLVPKKLTNPTISFDESSPSHNSDDSANNTPED